MVSTLTTAKFLDGLERAKLIQSANCILDQAVRNGRDESARGRADQTKACKAFPVRGGFGL